MRKRLISIFLLFISFIPPCYCAELKAFSPGETWLDTSGKMINAHGGQVLFDNGKYYWIGENRTTTRTNTGKVNIYSSKDLYNWDYKGIALDLSNQPEKFAIERPKVIYNDKNKKYYMWFHLELYGKYTTGMIGIAESKTLAQPFKFVKKFWPNPGINPISTQLAKKAHDLGKNISDSDAKFRLNFLRGNMFRDMTVFKDDDGKGYVIYESDGNKSIHIAEMTDDFSGLTGKYVRILVGDMNEAPTIVKKNNKYFLITSGVNGFAPSKARMAVSNNMLGNWEVSDCPISSNDVEDVKTTFNSQGTYIFKLPKSGGVIFMADRWDLKDLNKSTYVWLPVKFTENMPKIKWYHSWQY